jgi:hypothetical protein
LTREKSQDWLAVDAVSCELFSRLISLQTGKNTGNIAGSIQRLGDNATLDSGLEGQLGFLDQIRTGNEQGKRFPKIP